MKFKAYHKIKQFKDVIRSISTRADYKGKDDDGNPIYEASEKPTLTFEGTVKLHGTNAGITYTPEKGVVAQKRTSLLSDESLNAHMGFNSFVQALNKDYFNDLMKHLWDEYCEQNEQITLFGEWAGKGIQKGVGISELPKAFYVFGLKVSNEEKETFRWINTKQLKFDAEKVYNIYDFPTFKITIDFNNPALSQNKLVEIARAVEYDCPVARQLLGEDCKTEISFKEEIMIVPSGSKIITQKKYDGKLVGEGVVWTAFWNNEKYIFKVKGKRHSTSNTKTLAPVDIEKVKSINEFVDYACTENRMKQAIQETNASEKKDTPTLLRWIANDIISEEADTLDASNLEWKDVARFVSTKMRNYFFTIVDKIE